MIRSIPAPASAIALVFLFSVSLLPAFAFTDTNTYSFSQNHQLRDRGAEIKTLQQFLNAQGFPVAKSGPGSSGDETTFFGLLTYNALLKYQAAHDLPATGYFGPTTRALMSGSSTHSSSGGAPNGTQSSTQVTSPATSLQSTIPTPLPAVSLSFGGGGEGGGGGSVSTTPSCAITATSPTITLGNSSLLGWSSTNAVAASLTGAGGVAISSSENVTPNTTSAYTLTVTGSTGATATCSVTVTVSGSADTTPPTVSLTAPANGATVSGSSVALSATASDDVAVAYVQFKVGNTNIGSAVLSSPYTTTWNTAAGTSTPDGSYTLNAVAADTSGNLATSSVTVTVRNNPPVISSITTSTSYTTATTTWTTDEAASSELVYGLTTGYGSASSSPSFVTSHSIILSGLTASSTYHFAVVSTDAGGLTSTSTDQTFTTLATSTPPVLSSISSGTPTTTAATITWTTDQSANSKVVWGPTTGYGSSSSTASLVTSHSIILSGLATSTTYHFAVVSANTFGATATSSDQSFTTASGAPDTTPPTTPTNLVATPASSSEIDLSCTASNDNGGGDSCCSYKIYRDGTQVGTTTSGTTYNDTGLPTPSSLHSYWVSAYDAAGNVSTSSGTSVGVTLAGPDQYGTTWKPLKIGAGGLISGIDITPDGTKVIRTDTFGAYLWTGTQWQQLISSSSMPTLFANTQIGSGVYEIQIAPSNTNIFYMMFWGYVLKTTNRGSTWTQTSFNPVAANPNDGTKDSGPFIAVDPVNPNVIYVGTPSNGLWVTSDGATTWSNIAAVGTSTNLGGGQGGGELVAFDPTSSVVGGKTQGIYVVTEGTGVYHSTNGGASWTLTTGTPTSAYHVVVDQSGTVWVTSGSTNEPGSNLDKYAGGTWTNINLGGNSGANSNYYRMRTIAVDPANANRIYVGIDSGDLIFSSDGGSTWTGITWGAGTTVSPDIPWLSWAQNAQPVGDPFFDNSDMQFDPSGSNALYMAAGIGVWHANPPNTWTGFTWTSQSAGIEQLVADGITSPPGGNTVVASWDRPLFTITNPDVYPSTYGPNNVIAIAQASMADWASNNPAYLVADIGGESGYSTNGGQTWSPFASSPNGTGGNVGSIAAASSTDTVWVPSNLQPYYSKDGGQTWTQITTATSTGWAYYLDRQIVTADRVNIGTFYMYLNSGLFRSTDGGATWTLVHSGEITSFSSFNAKIRAVPYIAGELFFTGGPQSPDSLSSPANEPFEKSTDGGATWTAVPNVLEVFDFGFGKAAPGTTTPAIYIVGFVNNRYGIYESDDNANTWTQVGLWPIGSLDTPKTISGDMNAYGRVYVGFQGSGYAYGNTANAQIPPILSSISSGTPTSTAATITWTTDQSSNSEVVYGTTSAYGSATSTGSLVTSHSLTLTGLASATTYHYAVVSADAQGYTATSTDQAFQTIDTTPPSTPTGLTATSTTSEIDLSWTASTDPDSPVAGYKIFRNGTQVGTTTSGTTYADVGLATSTTYSYNVAAYDAAGNVSATSTSASATTPANSLNFAVDGSATGNTSATSCAASLTTTYSPDVVLVFATTNAAGASPTISDTSSLSWTQRAQGTAANTNQYITEWYAIASTTLSSDSITTNIPSGIFCTIAVMGISGANTSSPFDGNASVPAVHNNYPSDPIPATLSNRYDMAVAGFRTSDATPTAGSGWTSVQNGNYQIVEQQVFTSPGSISAMIGDVGHSQAGIVDAVQAHP